MKHDINEIEKLFKSIKDHIKKTNLKSFQNEIGNFDLWLEKINNYESIESTKNKKDFYNTFKNHLVAGSEHISSIFNFSLEADNLLKNIDEKYSELINFNFYPKDNEVNIEFNSQSANSIFDDYNKSKIMDNQDKSRSFLKTFDNQDEEKEEKDNYNKCSSCNEKAQFIYKKKCKLFCQKCLNSYFYNNKIIKFNNDVININESNKEKEKAIFLINVSNFIKNFLLKVDYILKNDKIELCNIDDNNKINYIRKILNYPKIEGNDFTSQINFISGINQMLIDSFDIKEFNNDEFITMNLNEQLIDMLKNIFEDQKRKNFAYAINIAEDNFNLFSDTEKNFFDEDDEGYVETTIDEEAKKLLNRYYYLFNLISKAKEQLNEKGVDNEKIMNLINKKLPKNPKINIIETFNNKKDFSDDFIRTKNFVDIPLQKMKIEYPKSEELYEFKTLYEDLLINQCKLKDFIDYRGNHIISNKIYTKNKNDIITKWYGIGIKVMGNFENDEWLSDNNEWMIAYYGVGGKSPSDSVKQKIIKLIKKGIYEGKSQKKMNSTDIRHKGKVGKGVYLSPNINFAENYCGIIIFNGNKYRVALMVKVKNDKIKQPADNSNIWVVNKDYIRTYRILFKKV